jgi:hypothetical protein
MYNPDTRWIFAQLTKKIREGLVTSSTPTLVLFLSPPEIPLMSGPPMYVSAQFIRPSALSILLVYNKNMLGNSMS